MRISDWSSDVCSSDLADRRPDPQGLQPDGRQGFGADPPALAFGRARRLFRELRLAGAGAQSAGAGHNLAGERDRNSVGTGNSVSARVDRGGRWIIKTNKSRLNK